MRRAALDKVNPHRPRRIRAQLLQLQTLLAHLQGKLAVGHLQWQAQALGPLLGLRLERRARASTWMRQAAGCSFIRKHAQKIKDRQKLPITKHRAFCQS
jgi:hypothetical protein